MSQKHKLLSNRKVYSVKNCGQDSPTQTQQNESPITNSLDKSYHNIKLIYDEYLQIIQEQPPITKEIMNLKDKLKLIYKSSLQSSKIEKEMRIFLKILIKITQAITKVSFQWINFIVKVLQFSKMVQYMQFSCFLFQQGIYFRVLVEEIFPILSRQHLLDDNGQTSGIGKYIWIEGSTYFGDFFGGSFNGFGQMTFVNVKINIINHFI
ncbi:unnamed protein product (macronuclear) [Paramecium tetraurelia]|uniref:Uncharacterized protein n=1 Tax=Paramecium tetraurelia TaxID=5888 RepID=A0DLL6_PARTE|nr:uncharacterized protein GSPATT00018251001 [Paramecium tetraurelia]CAK83933.1 unnamed protein product [Paramecium tetraurelia]|eukprot:XP_001451330.1 hypothetical protein (macronuclear) [Paramecium tetraurelia strain d4-2]